MTRVERSSTMRFRRRVRGGFTLIELIATIVILAAVSTVASSILLTAGDSYLDAATTEQLHNELSMAMDRIVREIREIDLDEGASDIAPDIDDVTGTSIAWGGDSSLSLNGMTVELVENGGATETLLTDVKIFQIDTYDEDNVKLSGTLSGDDCDVVRRVAITITSTRYDASDTLRSKVFIRSTMSGAGTDTP